MPKDDPLEFILVLFCTLFIMLWHIGTTIPNVCMVFQVHELREHHLYSGFYTDGSGIFAEAINGNAIGVAAWVSAIDCFFVVALGLSGVESHGGGQSKSDNGEHALLVPRPTGKA